jgi:streptogramin lyase
MSFRIVRRCAAIVFIAMVGLWLAGWSESRTSAAGATDILSGTVRDAGGAMEGIAVSARSTAPETFMTTTVYTDAKGSYIFPPLPAGSYEMWAQAVGFHAGRATVNLANRKVSKNFSLNAIADKSSPAYTNQLNGAEWLQALPAATSADRRMRDIFRNNCTSCHSANFVLQNRFDENGWRAQLTFMERTSAGMALPNLNRRPAPIINHFKQELASYLARINGPGESPLRPRPLPRPSGEATQVVVTEYDIPSVEHPHERLSHISRDWSDGAPARYFARGSHDAEVDAQGMVWIADNVENPVRTIARLNPNTGEVKNFALPGGEGGMAKTSHGIVIDAKGFAWFNADGGLGRINTKTEELEFFDVPKGMAQVGGSFDLDVKNGHVWMSTNKGALRFDPKTSTFQEFLSVTQRPGSQTYGVATDSEGNGWWGQMAIDIVGRSDIKTGTSSEVRLPPVQERLAEVTEEDRTFYETAESAWNSTYPWSQGPRRLGADRSGNSIWVAASWGDSLVQIDIKTNQVTHHQAPLAHSHVYDAVVDKNGMVWTNLMATDRVARFNPKTKTWVEFQIPTHGAETRYVAVDNTKDPVEVWLPAGKASRMVRFQFRTQKELAALQARR